MATLSPIPRETPGLTVSITPLTPNPERPLDPYEVQVRKGEQVVFKQRCEGHQYAMGHYYLTRIAEAFEQSGRLCTSRIEWTNQFGDTYKREASVNESPGWFDLYLTAHEFEEQTWIEANFFFRCPQSASGETGLPAYRNAFVTCTVEEAEKFGRELLAETEAMEELGDAIQAQDDAGDG